MAIKRYLITLMLLFISLFLVPLSVFSEPQMTSDRIEGELIDYGDRNGSAYALEVKTSSGTRTVTITYYLPNSTTYSTKEAVAGNTYECTIHYWPGNDPKIDMESASCTKTGDSPTDPKRPVPDPVDPSPTPTPTPATDTTPKTDSKALEATIGSSASNPLPEILKTKDCPDTGIYESGILKGLTCKGATQGSTGLVQTVLVIRNLINGFLLPLAGSVFVLMFVAGGVLYITAGGDEKRAELAKKTLTAAVIGLVISALAYVIIGVFASILGGGIAQ